MVKFHSLCVAAALLVASTADAFVIVQPPTAVSSKTMALGASTEDVPSMAQTHMQGPLKVMGSGKALSTEELEEVKQELERIKKRGGLTEPVRSFMEDEDTQWRFGDKPDYSVTNLLYLKERSTIHSEGSLEQVVENLVKTVSDMKL
jgi:hypothetical protein